MAVVPVRDDAIKVGSLLIFASIVYSKNFQTLRYRMENPCRRMEVQLLF